MFNFSKFKNYPVFLKEKEIGYINDIVFDKIDISVIGFIRKKSILNYSYLELKNLEKIENEKLIFSREDENKNIENYEILGKRVYDLFGNRVGTVEDIEFYSHSGKLGNLDIDININMYSTNRFFGKSFTKNYVKVQAKNIISFEKDRIIIKNSNSIKESKKILENINKFFINIGRTSYSFKKI